MEGVLRSILLERCGIRFWKIVKRNNRSGSYIFNWCSVQYFTLLYFSEDSLLITGYLKAEVSISVEIQADSDEGFDENLRRTVKENCNVLKFKNAEFED